MWRTMVRAVFVTKDRSGSRLRVSGVGTQMTITSQCASSENSALARKRLLPTISASRLSGTASI